MNDNRFFKLFYLNNKFVLRLPLLFHTPIELCMFVRLRLFLHSYFTPFWAIFMAETLHGISFALFWSASVIFISASESDYSASHSLSKKGPLIYGILGALFSGAGFGIGNLVGGFVYVNIDANVHGGTGLIYLFRYLSLAICVHIGLVCLTWIVYRRSETLGVKQMDSACNK